MKWLVRIGVLVWLSGVVIMPVFGFFNPSEAHVAVLKSFTNEPSVLISAAGSGVTCVGGVCDHSEDRSQRGYLTFPSSIFPGDITFIDVYYDGRHEIHQVHYLVYLTLVLCVAGVVYTRSWVRRAWGDA